MIASVATIVGCAVCIIGLYFWYFLRRRKSRRNELERGSEPTLVPRPFPLTSDPVPLLTAAGGNSSTTVTTTSKFLRGEKFSVSSPPDSQDIIPTDSVPPVSAQSNLEAQPNNHVESGINQQAAASALTRELWWLTAQVARLRSTAPIAGPNALADTAIAGPPPYSPPPGQSTP